MSHPFTTLAACFDHGFDTVIDVRSPAEFAYDHIPGAINLPVLSDAQRAEVGTIYVQDSPFKARKLGAALVARNAADHIAGPLALHDGGWKPLVYCWRGGQRSGSFTGILQQIGWRADVVSGGYQAYRRLVQNSLYESPIDYNLVILDGNTGTGKTEILHRLAADGIQMIDLEGLANHRGSVLGEMPGGQPSQKWFESQLAERLNRLDPNTPTLIEAESSKIGQITIPPSLWASMKSAPRIEVTASVAARATYLAQVYTADGATTVDAFTQSLESLRVHRGHDAVDGWVASARAGAFEAVAASLIETHYDPAYARARKARDRPTLSQFAAKTLDEAGQQAITEQIAGFMREM